MSCGIRAKGFSLGILMFFILLFSSAAFADEPVELTVMTWMYQPTSPAWVEIVQAFETQHPHIKISLNSGGREEQIDKLLLMAAGGISVDVVWTDAAMTNVLVLQELLEGLNPFYNLSATPMQEYPAAGFEEHTYGGENYAFPSTLGTYFIYYNKDIFDQRGVAYPQQDWDQELFLETARKLRDRERGIYAVDNRNWITTFLPWLWAYGGDWFTPDRHRSLLNSDIAIDVQQFLVDLIYVYDVHVPYPDDTDYFAAGQLAMIHSSTWDLQGTEETPPKWPFRWDVVPSPKGPMGQFSVVQTNGWAIPKAAADKQKAWEFISWFNGPEGQRILAKHGEFPAHLPTARTESFLHLPDETRETIFNTVMMGRPFPVNPAWGDSLSIAWEFQDSILAGEQDVITGLNQAAERINARIDELAQHLEW